MTTTPRFHSRRRVLQQGALGIAAFAANRAHGLAQEATPTPGAGVMEATLHQFEKDVADAMDTFTMVGAAIAIVDRDGVRFQRGFGVRDLASGLPVTPETHFLVASTTKSMSSLLVATLVDDGALAWDQPVREIWADFRAPNDALTATLRVRDLLGMATGIGEPPAVSTFHQGDLSASDLLRSLAALPVTAPPHTTYFYNNTVFAVGGYLPALLQSPSLDALETTYAHLLSERVYAPAGMTTARLSDDPRPYSHNYATGYGPDFTLGTAAQPFAPVGSFAPVGGTLASLNDMAAYVTMQLNGGLASNGKRVVSAANLAACWQPQIDLLTSPVLDPDLVSAGYGMGWISQTYRDGQRLVWHNGGIDGFSSFIGFFPEANLGLVILSNIGPLSRGLYFAPYVLNLLLSAQFGLNQGVNAAVVAQYQAAETTVQALAAQAIPVDPDAVAPYLGSYEKGWRLTFAPDGALLLRQSSRAIRLAALPDGSYVMAGGVIPGLAVRLYQDAFSVPWLEIEGIETVRWTNGPA